MSSSSEQAAKIRSNFTYNLKSIIKRIQYNAASSYSTTLQTSDVTNSLCYVLEAIFLTGLKSPYSTKTIVDVSTKSKIAAPTFWPFVTRFTHGDTSSRLSSLTYITNEIGLCRSWLREALNDGLLLSYVTTVVEEDFKLKKKFYDKEAYWFDQDQLIIMKGLLQGIANYTFDLPYNVSLLNSWGTTPLELAGYFKVSQLPVLFAPELLNKTIFTDQTGTSNSSFPQPSLERHVDEDLTTPTGADLDILVSRKKKIRRRESRSKKVQSLIFTENSSLASSESFNNLNSARALTPQELPDFRPVENDVIVEKCPSVPKLNDESLSKESNPSESAQEQADESGPLDLSALFLTERWNEEDNGMEEKDTSQTEWSATSSQLAKRQESAGNEEMKKSSEALSYISSEHPVSEADKSGISRGTPSPPGNALGGSSNNAARSTWIDTAR